jgi:hypothetical protein
MPNQSLTVGFSNPSGAAYELVIEQGEPNVYDGYLSRSALYLAIWAFLDNNTPQEPQCTTDFTVDLFVYRNNLNLQYTLFSTYGVLGPPINQSDYSFTEKVKFQMKDKATLKYPNFGILGTKWVGGKVWDENGLPTTEPTITVNNKDITFDKKVYGTLLVTYKLNRDKYVLDITPRTDATQNAYSAVAYATHLGGPTWKELDIPADVEEQRKQCLGGYGKTSILSVDPKIPKAPNVDAKTVKDYCTQETLSESP